MKKAAMKVAKQNYAEQATNQATPKHNKYKIAITPDC